jgi:hypothetical protein
LEYFCKRVADLLEQRRVVMWYDGDRVFAGLLDRLRQPGTVVVSTAGSTLRARREGSTPVCRWM